MTLIISQRTYYVAAIRYRTEFWSKATQSAKQHDENKRISLPEERKRGKRRKRGERVFVVPWSTSFFFFSLAGESCLCGGDGGGWGGSGKMQCVGVYTFFFLSLSILTRPSLPCPTHYYRTNSEVYNLTCSFTLWFHCCKPTAKPQRKTTRHLLHRPVGKEGRRGRKPDKDTIQNALHHK